MPDGGQSTRRIVQGDAFDVLDDLPTDYYHAVVTDPPYAEGGYDGFMGKDWDAFDGPREFQDWNRRWAEKAKRALKPGGHLLAFGSDDGHHRTATGIEDAGFEIRTTVTWHYGEGFPKALDVSKAIDRMIGAERDVKGHYTAPDGRSRDHKKTTEGQRTYGDDCRDPSAARAVTAPASDDAKKWDGWKTALKPATEFVVLARAPLSEDTVAENVLEHDTGALNVDECLISLVDGEEVSVGYNEPEMNEGWKRDWMDDEEQWQEYKNEKVEKTNEEGRYPANVVFDVAAAARLDREVGDTTEHDGRSWHDQPTGADTVYGDYEGDHTVETYDDSGGPSRYFYTSKATTAERTLNGRIDNPHPTVKPVDLMEWLVKLVTREGQRVLDPFAGTGTTGRAAKNLGREFLLIEQDERWADVARVRCGLTPEDPGHVRADDDPQTGLEAYADGGGGRD